MLCGQINNHREILKQMRLGELRLIDDGHCLSLVDNTKKNLDLNLSGILPTLDTANNFY